MSFMNEIAFDSQGLAAIIWFASPSIRMLPLASALGSIAPLHPKHPAIVVRELLPVRKYPAFFPLSELEWYLVLTVVPHSPVLLRWNMRHSSTRPCSRESRCRFDHTGRNRAIRHVPPSVCRIEGSTSQRSQGLIFGDAELWDPP